MEVEKLHSVMCCISSNETKTDLGLSRWDGIPTFPVVCTDLLRRLKLHRWFFPLLPFCQVRNKERNELQMLLFKNRKAISDKTDGYCTEN